MAAVQLQKLGFHQFGGVVVPGNTDCLSGCADGFQHKVNNLVQTVFVNFAVLNEMVVFDIVLDNLPVNLYCAIAFRFRSFPFRRRSRFAMHYIRYDVLYAYVLSRLQYWSVLAQQDGDKLLKRLLNASDKERNTARKRQTAELKKAEKRKAEVDTLFAKMYEDWSAGRITEYNFNMLSEKYQGEQRELDAKIERLHEAMEVAAQTAVDAEKWIGLMKQYVNPTELTAELLNTLIEKILVHEAVKSEDGSREQEVEIFYRFIGKIE